MVSKRDKVPILGRPPDKRKKGKKILLFILFYFASLRQIENISVTISKG